MLQLHTTTQIESDCVPNQHPRFPSLDRSPSDAFICFASSDLHRGLCTQASGWQKANELLGRVELCQPMSIMCMSRCCVACRVYTNPWDVVTYGSTQVVQSELDQIRSFGEKPAADHTTFASMYQSSTTVSFSAVSAGWSLQNRLLVDEVTLASSVGLVQVCQGLLVRTLSKNV